MDHQGMSGEAWASVLLGLVNTVQVVALAWIGREQRRSSKERKRRQITDPALCDQND
jgi:hypothetical protein